MKCLFLVMNEFDHGHFLEKKNAQAQANRALVAVLREKGRCAQ